MDKATLQEYNRQVSLELKMLMDDPIFEKCTYISYLERINSVRAEFYDTKLEILPYGALANYSLDELYIKAPIKELPDAIERLTDLKVLSMENSPDQLLERISPKIGNLKKLEELVVGRKLEQIPDEIGNLKNLKSLILTGNNIQEFPFTMASLVNLEKLGVSNPAIVPDFIRQLPKLNTIGPIEY